MYTAGDRGAGTDGNVYITFVGDKGAAPEVLITPSMLINGDESTLFKRGTSNKFSIKGLDVGDISHVTLRLVRQAAGNQRCLPGDALQSCSLGVLQGALCAAAVPASAPMRS